MASGENEASLRLVSVEATQLWEGQVRQSESNAFSEI